MGADHSDGCVYGVAPGGAPAGFFINKVLDVAITSNTVAGFDFGVQIGADTSNVDVKLNKIGNYVRQFGAGNRRNNAYGVALTAGNGDYINIESNSLLENDVTLLDQGATGMNSRIVNNAGYNGVQPPSDATAQVPASGGSLRNGKAPAEYAFFGSGSFLILTQNNLPLRNALPCSIVLQPNEAVVLNYISTNVSATRRIM